MTSRIVTTSAGAELGYIIETNLARSFEEHCAHNGIKVIVDSREYWTARREWTLACRAIYDRLPKRMQDAPREMDA